MDEIGKKAFGCAFSAFERKPGNGHVRSPRPLGDEGGLAKSRRREDQRESALHPLFDALHQARTFHPILSRGWDGGFGLQKREHEAIILPPQQAVLGVVKGQWKPSECSLG